MWLNSNTTQNKRLPSFSPTMAHDDRGSRHSGDSTSTRPRSRSPVSRRGDNNGERSHDSYSKPHNGSSRRRSDSLDRNQTDREHRDSAHNDRYSKNGDNVSRSRKRDTRTLDDDLEDPKHTSSERDRRRKVRREDKDDDDGDDRITTLPDGVEEISSDDFFLKATEFKVWLEEEKDKKLDQLSADHARRTFKKKFVKAWNHGQLPQKYYDGIRSGSISASTSSSYAWSFSKASQRELDDAASIRKSVDTGSRPSPVTVSGRVANTFTNIRGGTTIGPTLPPTHNTSTTAIENLQMARERAANEKASGRAESQAEWKKARRDLREEEKDNRATGKERLMEKRKEGNAVHKEFKEAKESGGMQEFDEDTLMGTGSSYQAMIAARDRSQGNSKRQQRQEEKAAVLSDKVKQYRSKEDSTMDMFRKLAAERFGPT